MGIIEWKGRERQTSEAVPRGGADCFGSFEATANREKRYWRGRRGLLAAGPDDLPPRERILVS